MLNQPRQITTRGNCPPFCSNHQLSLTRIHSLIAPTPTFLFSSAPCWWWWRTRGDRHSHHQSGHFDLHYGPALSHLSRCLTFYLLPHPLYQHQQYHLLLTHENHFPFPLHTTTTTDVPFFDVSLSHSRGSVPLSPLSSSAKVVKWWSLTVDHDDDENDNCGSVSGSSSSSRGERVVKKKEKWKWKKKYCPSSSNCSVWVQTHEDSTNRIGVVVHPDLVDISVRDKTNVPLKLNLVKLRFRRTKTVNELICSLPRFVAMLRSVSLSPLI